MNIKLKGPVGLFLCGGGAFGSFQSGALKKLCENSFEADVVAGFSIGALNGATYCFDKVSQLKNIWASVDNKKLFKFSPSYHHMPIELYKTYSADNLFKSALSKFEDKIMRLTLFSNKPLYEVMRSWLGSSDLIFNKKVVFHVIAHCVERKLPYIMTYDGRTSNSKVNFIDSLIASSSIPTVFPPIKIEEHGDSLHLVDGGAIGIATINLNIMEGCKTILIISNSSDYDMSYEGKGFLGNFESRVRRTLAVHVQKIFESQVFVRSRPDVYVIKPMRLLDSGIIDFTPERCLRHFAHGEDCALKFLKDIK